MPKFRLQDPYDDKARNFKYFVVNDVRITCVEQQCGMQSLSCDHLRRPADSEKFLHCLSVAEYPVYSIQLLPGVTTMNRNHKTQVGVCTNKVPHRRQSHNFPPNQINFGIFSASTALERLRTYRSLFTPYDSSYCYTKSLSGEIRTVGKASKSVNRLTSSQRTILGFARTTTCSTKFGINTTAWMARSRDYKRGRNMQFLQLRSTLQINMH